MIEKVLISDVCLLMCIDKNNVLSVFQQCKLIGFLRIPEATKLVNSGFPVYTIIGTVLGTNALDGHNKVSDGKITYDDLLCILGIFAQDLMQRSQQKY